MISTLDTWNWRFPLHCYQLSTPCFDEQGSLHISQFRNSQGQRWVWFCRILCTGNLHVPVNLLNSTGNSPVNTTLQARYVLINHIILVNIGRDVTNIFVIILFA